MKQLPVTSTLLRRPVTIIMASLMVIGFGLFSLGNLKVTLMPEFNIPILAVSVNYSNVAPEDMSRLVVEPIEGAIMGVEGIRQLESNVRRGGAFLILRLQPGTNIQQTEIKLREAMDRIRTILPEEANQPVIFQFDPDRSPIMQISLESSVLGLDALRELSVEFVEPRFERIPGVAAADTRGGLQRNFYVSLDRESMALHKVTPNQVTQAIRQNNVDVPIGSILAGPLSYSVRAGSTYESLEEISQTVVRREDGGRLIRVGDVASVENTYADVRSVEEVNGRNSVTVEVQKQSDANTLEVAQAVVREMEAFQNQLPGSVYMQVLSSEADFISQSIRNLAQSAGIALVVVVLILFLFMGGWRIALIVAISIPVSLTATFTAMYMLGITLNIISITGLALAIGLLVDNSIVVTESISRRLEQGEERFHAALEGTREVGGALLGSTLTTLGVFVPILGVSGVAGAVTRDLVLTISIAITSSFLASLIVIPVLSSILIRRKDFERRGWALRKLISLEENYIRNLYWLLKRRYWVALASVGILVGIWWMFQSLPSEFFPQSDTGELNVQIELPPGTGLAETAEELRSLTAQILEEPDVRTVITSIGRQRWTTASNMGQMQVRLNDQQNRSVSSDQMVTRLQEMLDDPDRVVEVSVAGGGVGGMRMGRGGPQMVQLSLVGTEMDRLQELGARIEERLRQEEMVRSVNNGRSRPMPEWEYYPDRERIARLGSNASEVATAFGTQSRGSRAGYFREGGREIPIEVRNDRDQFQYREDLFSLELLQTDEARVPILALGHFEMAEGVQTLLRRDRELVLDINVMIQGLPEEARPIFQQILEEEIPLPDGYRYDFAGSLRDQDQSAREFFIALVLALLLTYMVMASLFENFRDPLIIMMTVPLAFFGSLLALVATGTSLSVPAYIGIVILVGIVVNNGIVLVDTIRQQTDGSARMGETWMVLFIQACRRRMRPILLTAMTTIFSMVPLALEMGAGAETWSPLARSVIGGLAFSTLLTLFVVPALALWVTSKRRLDGSLKGHGPQDPTVM
ncbi:MAG: efflux RND transporter permease subunit [Bacteroidota bacterium]